MTPPRLLTMPFAIPAYWTPESSNCSTINNSTLTSAILDRVLHHADTVVIEGRSFRTKDEIDR